MTEDLVRRFVVVVENIAEGETPRTHLGFMAPKDTFKSSRREDGIFLDPSGYRRYDTLTEVFSSLDSEGTAELAGPRGTSPNAVGPPALDLSSDLENIS